jgi:hypothetical protein
MRHLNEIKCFVKAVELKSPTAAAKALKLPKSKIRSTGGGIYAKLANGAARHNCARASSISL